MNYKKIITHAGHFHTDEILAIATIFHFLGYELPIERKFEISEDEFENPNILVLDIGKRLEPEKSNFDHHQNGDSYATNVLVLDYFCKDKELSKWLKTYLYNYCDAVDRGKIVKQQIDNINVPSLSDIVNSFARFENGFYIALNIVKQILKGYVEKSMDRIKGEQIWKSLQEECNGLIKIQHNSQYITGWHEMAEQDRVLLLIHPCERTPNGYRITSRDTNIIKIPQNENQIFLHANQFTAAYKNYDSALNHAVYIIANHFKVDKVLTPEQFFTTCSFLK